MLIIILLLPIPACIKSGDEVAVIEIPVEEKKDSAEYLVNLSFDNSVFKSQDKSVRIGLYVYEADGLRELERVGEIGADQSYGFRSTGGDRIVVAIANCPFEINRTAIAKYDSMELLAFNFDDDNPVLPLMSGQCTVQAGGCSDLKLVPLMCCVEIVSVTNDLDGYRRLEDPRVFLSNMNPSAEVLRHDGFRPSEQYQDTLRTSLPCDVGVFTQYPGTKLYCYPNDSEEETPGTPYTIVNFECEIDGKTVLLKSPLPPLKRNSYTAVNLEVDSEKEYRFSFN